MRTKGKRPSTLVGSKGDPVLRSWLEAAQLKRLYRQGWLKRGVPEADCESVADHSFGVAMLALFLSEADETVDVGKAVLLALVHELGEVWAGDITPVDGISRERKAAMELESLKTVLAGLPGSERIETLWEEFEEGNSAEARLVKQLDRLEMGLQAAVYKADGAAGMEEFFRSAEASVRDRRLQELLGAATEVPS